MGCLQVAWENSQHFAMPSIVSQRNDVWGIRAEILYHQNDLGSASDWLKFALNNQMHYPDLGSDSTVKPQLSGLFGTWLNSSDNWEPG